MRDKRRSYFFYLLALVIQKGAKMPVIKKQGRKFVKKVRKKKQNAVGRISPIGFDENEGISINIYGKSATGKTTFWATFPKPILAIVCSGSQNPGELRSIDTPEYRKTIKQVTLNSCDEIFELVEYQREYHEFKTIVLDHASGLQDLKLKEALGLEEIPVQKSWGLASRQVWGQVANETKGLLNAILGLSCNRVIIAQERAFNTDAEEVLLMPFVGSALTPSVAGWLNPACDYIVQAFIRGKTKEQTIKLNKKTVKKTVPIKGVEYCLRTAPDPIYTTKFRTPKGLELPEVLIDADYGKFMDLIKGE